MKNNYFLPFEISFNLESCVIDIRELNFKVPECDGSVIIRRSLNKYK